MDEPRGAFPGGPGGVDRTGCLIMIAGAIACLVVLAFLTWSLSHG